jgi:hypothetical protein
MQSIVVYSISTTLPRNLFETHHVSHWIKSNDIRQ